MKQPTTITINSHKIRTMTCRGKKWYHRADVIKALGISDTDGLQNYSELNVATGHEINDPGQKLVSIISESGLNKLVPAEPTKDEQISILKNHIGLTEETTYLNKLEAIDSMNPGITQDILVYAQSLHSKVLGKTPLDELKETMLELSDNHPRGFQRVLRRIDIDHDFLFDIEIDG